MIMKIQKAWAALDTDKNNKLSKDELSKLIKSLVPDIKDDPDCEEKIQTTVRSKMLVRLRNLVIFGDFQNNFRPKNRNFQNCPI